MKKLIFSIALVVLTAVLDSTFSIGLPIQCYVVGCFFLGASVLELTRQTSKAEFGQTCGSSKMEKTSKQEEILRMAV